MDQVSDSGELRRGMARRLVRKAAFSGTMIIPAVPGMIDEYVRLCDDTFKTAGVHFNDEELARLRFVLAEQMAVAFESTSRSEIVITYACKDGFTTLDYHVTPRWLTIEEAYDKWFAVREPPFFGTEPDARVWRLAAEASDPASCRVLDIGAGTGRNCLALARRGHRVDAVEMSSQFAGIIRAEAMRESLDVRVIQRDISALTVDDLRSDYQLIIMSEVVNDFRSVAQLREVFELAARSLALGGQLVFNVFLEKPGYLLDAAARELGQQFYCSMFTYAELAEATALLPLDLVADDSVYEYEKANLPAGCWPQTSWYVGWVSGQDVFDVPRERCPIELRWLVYRKAW